MENILSHTFSYETLNSSSEMQYKLISITEEDEKKHFVQYIQYEKKDETSILLRYINIKVDRAYYLEIANINLDNINRRRYIFAVLGKRRFGANNKRMDFYLHQELDKSLLSELYTKQYKSKEFKACYTERTEYSLNEYRLLSLEVQNRHIFFLDQINTTKRKKLHKIFCVELFSDEVEYFQTIEKGKKKAHYIFNKIGKIHFRSLPKQLLHLSSKYKDIHSLALSQLVDSSAERELTSRVNDNLLFRKLKEKVEEDGRLDQNLHTACINVLNNPRDKDTVNIFTTTINQYIQSTSDISQLQDILSHFSTIQVLVETRSIAYLFDKDDSDLKDIFLYMLEAFTTWNNYLHNKNEDVKAFNIATVDFRDSLRYLVDTCYKFKHEYKCLDIKKEDVQQEDTTIPTTTTYNEDITKTSAQEYFNEIELETDVYDELHELETEIELYLYTNEYNEELNTILIKFFEGYTSALNPLFEFKDLSYSLMLLSQKLSEYAIDENAEMLLVLIQAFISDLLEWKRNVLVEKTAEDIHYMDKSFYSNIAQIEMSIEHRDSVEEEESIEFF